MLGLDGLTPVDDRIDVRDGAIGDASASRRLPVGRPATGGAEGGRPADPTYTAKAIGGYVADVTAGRFDGIGGAVFLHTGGEPALFVGRS